LKISASLRKKLARIRLVIMDVDGVLSDGRIIYDANGIEYKSFDAHDGYGISKAKSKGLQLAIISGRKSKVVTIRATYLGISEVYQGRVDKVSVFKKIQKKLKYGNEQCCFIGDDEFDLPLLRIVGFSAAPADAMENVRQAVDYVTKKKGGRGAVREVLDMILFSRHFL
jgi:3-deoxy-D-manno-octulosonate 8-phosphate phosphatase (KDO 8-P phosphatase)